MGLLEDALSYRQKLIDQADAQAAEINAKYFPKMGDVVSTAENLGGMSGGMTRFGKQYGTVSDRILKKELSDSYLRNDSTQITNRLMKRYKNLKKTNQNLDTKNPFSYVEERIVREMLDANAGRGRHLAGISPSSMQSKGDFNWRELEALAGGPVLHPTRNLGAVPDLKEAGKMSFGPYLTQGQRQVDNKYILEKALDKTRRDYRDLSQKFDGTRDSAELGSEIKNDLKNYFYKRGGTIHPKDIPEVSGPNTEVDPAGWGYLDLYKLAKDQQKRFQKDFINQERKQLEQELSSKLAAREKAAGLNFQLPEEVALQQKELSKYARKFEKNKSDINKGFINLFESAKNYTPIVEEVAPPSKMGSYVDEFIANKQPVNELTTPKGWEQIGDSPVTKALDENGWPIDQYSEYLKRIGAADKSSITGPKILTKAQRDAFNKWKGKK